MSSLPRLRNWLYVEHALSKEYIFFLFSNDRGKLKYYQYTVNDIFLASEWININSFIKTILISVQVRSQ